MTLTLFVAQAAASGCSSTRAYEGGDRPDSETSIIYFYGDRGVDLSEMAVDGVEQGIFDMGLRVLPGEHTVSAAFTVSGREECYGASYCTVRQWSGRCRGAVRAEAGGRYAVRIQGSGDTATMLVTPDDAPDGVSGSGTCRTAELSIVPTR